MVYRLLRYGYCDGVNSLAPVKPFLINGESPEMDNAQEDDICYIDYYILNLNI